MFVFESGKELGLPRSTSYTNDLPLFASSENANLHIQITGVHLCPYGFVGANSETAFPKLTHELQLIRKSVHKRYVSEYKESQFLISFIDAWCFW